MKRWIILLTASVLAFALLTGCGCGGCMGCGSDNTGDYADDGVVDGSVGNGKDNIVGGDSTPKDDADDMIDDFVDGIDDTIDDFTDGRDDQSSGSGNGNANGAGSGGSSGNGNANGNGIGGITGNGTANDGSTANGSNSNGLTGNGR